jgi:phosphogluconate dehydratase
MIGELLEAGQLHPDTRTVAGEGLGRYTREPKLKDGALVWEDGATASLNEKILRPVRDPFQPSGGLKELTGNLGQGVMKVSAVAPERHVIEAPARVFHDQESVKAAFRAGELDRDVVVIVRFQGPKANGMPELHSLTPLLSVVQDRGHKVALVTDGRMSGASGKVPAAIHVCPEAADGGPLAHVRDGDLIRVDAVAGVLSVLTEGALDRPAATADLSANAAGIGREMFQIFRDRVGPAANGARITI